MLSPRLYDNIGFQLLDNITSSRSTIVGRKSTNMIFVAMRGNNRIELPAAIVFDLISNNSGIVLARVSRSSCTPKVDQYIPFKVLIPERQQVAITKSDIVGADCKVNWI